MKKSFLIFGVLLIIYLIRLNNYPTDDKNLRKIFENQDYKSSKTELKILVTKEPDLKNDFFTIRGQIKEICFSNLLDCSPVESKSFIVAKIYSKDLLSTLEKINESNNQDLEVGDLLYVSGLLNPTIELKNIETIDPSKEGYEQYLRKEKVFFEIKNAKIIEVQKTQNININKILIRFRKSVEKSISDSLEKPASDLAQGLVISGKGSMTKELLDDFTRVGLIHIVVLSGSNVSIISGALFALLSRLHYSIRIGVGVFAMSAFALMTGAMPPVLRSVIMSSLPLLREIYQRIKFGNEYENNIKNLQSDRSTIKLLIVTAMMMAIYNPLLPLYDMSFQLSFMATLGLMILTQPISNALSFIPEKMSLREIISSTLATQVFVTPLILTIHDQVSTVFLIANLMVLPILPIVMFFVALTSLSSFIIPSLNGVISAVSSILLNIIISITEYLSDLSFATFTLATISKTQVLVIYILILSLILFRQIYTKYR